MYTSHKSNYLSVAREVLKQADTGPRQAEHVLLDADLETGYHGLQHAAFPACKRWLLAFFCVDGISTATETAILSTNTLPQATTSETLDIADLNGMIVRCDLKAKHTCKGAGGRPVIDDKELPAVQKRGPDTWLVSAVVRGMLALIVCGPCIMQQAMAQLLTLSR